MALKVLSLFSGIGAFEKALKNLDIDYELVNYCEIDKYASKSYAKVHNVSEDLNLGDITKVDTFELPRDIDLVCHGSPCQSFSLAGKQAGGDEGSGTQSSLMWETVRIVKDVRPKFVLWENVKNVLGKKHIHNFDAYRAALKDFGYNSYYQVLNAKDYGVPQNRERVYVISVREDIDTGKFKFPEPIELKLRLKDVLEDKVDEKYYLSEAMKKYISADNEKWTGNNDKALVNKSIASTINTGEGSRRCDASNYIAPEINEENVDLKVIRKFGLFDTETSKHQAGSVYDVNGLSPTLDTMQGGWRQPLVEDSLWTETQSKMITKDGDIKRYIHSDIIDKFEEGQSADISFPNGYNKANRVHDTMPALNNTTTKSSFVYKESQAPLRIRKLTPKECWRLQGFSDSDFMKAEQVVSNTQLYKQAGNSICVPVLESIYKELQKQHPDILVTKKENV